MAKLSPAPEKATPVLQIHPAKFRTFVIGKEVKLPPKEFKLLSALARAKGKALTRSDLMVGYYDSEGARNIDARTVDQHIARLRKNLGRVGGKIIETVVGFGYRADGIEIIEEKQRWGKIEKIMRVFSTKKTGAYVTAWIEGDVLADLREGHKFKLPA